MPTLLRREDALARIRQEGGDFACLMCALRDGSFGPLFLLHQDERALVLLPRYVRRWGHILVLLREHRTSFEELSEADWIHLARLARHAACVIERTLIPRRCYLASTGSSDGELTQSSTHIHLHVIPIFQPDDRPASVFSWSEGIYPGDDGELSELLACYRSNWLMG
ncbi:MAG: HIT family protein [Myxococcales bacterium]|nr:HIT family protein [Polyangiaceae bacterium]MDW8250655.1 HIT family protein [Myxococcales bacterium]